MLAAVSVVRRKPWVVWTVGWVIALQIAGARLRVQMAMAVAIKASNAMNSTEWKTSQAYHRSTTGWVAGTILAMRNGTELPASVPMRTSKASAMIS